jgi:hypothetical protein
MFFVGAASQQSDSEPVSAEAAQQRGHMAAAIRWTSVRLSSEARQVVVVVAAFVAGGALALMPLTSGPLPFRNSPNYPVWAFLIATVCGACPVVWSRGRRALAVLPIRESPVPQVLGYVICAVAFAAVSLLVNGWVYRNARRVVTLPYISARFNIVLAAAVIAVAPSILAMHRVGRATRGGDVSPSNLVAWRAILQSQLAALGTVIVLSTLTTAAYRTAGLAAFPSHAGDFTVLDVLLFGAWLTGTLALIYVPPSERLRRHAREFVDETFPIPDQFAGDWQQQLQRRHDLTAALRINETSLNSIQNALIIAGPLITSALTLLIPVH